MHKLNLGCGNRKLSGWINVDKFGHCDPDIQKDLEITPWPWETNSVSEVILSHVLEHLGNSSDVFLNIIKEIYRICASGAVIRITVPHPRHDNFVNDPTHVRAITPELLMLFDKEWNAKWEQEGAANTPLANILNVDFFIENVAYRLDKIWESKFKNSEIDEDELNFNMRTFFNVISEIHIDLVVRKQSEFQL